MKQNSKMIVIAILSALMLSAIASTSASAETCQVKAGSAKYQLCINGTKITEPTTIAIESHTTSPMILDLDLWSPGLYVECKTVAEPNSVFNDNPTLPLSLSFLPRPEGCSLKGTESVVKKCSIPSSKSFAPVTGTLESLAVLYMKPSSGEALWQWPLENKPGQTCPSTLKGTHSTIGAYNCTFQAAGVEAVEHELQCASSSRRRTYLGGGEETPISYTQMFSLGGAQKGAKFSIYESK
jgi:hypothetical protein